jgi:hypothetical protein
MQLDRQRLAYLLVVAIVASLAAVIAVESEAFLPVFSVTVLLAIGVLAINWLKARR